MLKIKTITPLLFSLGLTLSLNMRAEETAANLFGKNKKIEFNTEISVEKNWKKIVTTRLTFQMLVKNGEKKLDYYQTLGEEIGEAIDKQIERPLDEIYIHTVADLESTLEDQISDLITKAEEDNMSERIYLNGRLTLLKKHKKELEKISVAVDSYLPLLDISDHYVQQYQQYFDDRLDHLDRSIYFFNPLNGDDEIARKSYTDAAGEVSNALLSVQSKIEMIENQIQNLDE